jgi:hypothetical protein
VKIFCNLTIAIKIQGVSFWIDQWLPFLFDSNQWIKTPRGIKILNPYREQAVRDVCDIFYSKYYHDDQRRTPIFGINPGRLGAGITGIGFTDPQKLEMYCGISNDFPKKEELSSKFVYEWIIRNGAIEDFYKQFIILSVCPLGFVSDGKNINYYDQVSLTKNSEKLIVMQQNLIQSAVDGEVAYTLGKGQNFKYFEKLNNQHKWFKHVIPLPHPRWVLQYRYHSRYELMDNMSLILKQVRNE